MSTGGSSVVTAPVLPSTVMRSPVLIRVTA